MQGKGTSQGLLVPTQYYIRQWRNIPASFRHIQAYKSFPPTHGFPFFYNFSFCVFCGDAIAQKGIPCFCNYAYNLNCKYCSLVEHFMLTCMIVLPTVNVQNGLSPYLGFTVIIDSLRASCGKEIMYNFGFTPHRSLGGGCDGVCSFQPHLSPSLIGDISFHPICHST